MVFLKSKSVADDIKKWAADFESRVGTAAADVEHEHTDLDHLHKSFKEYIFIITEDMEELGKEAIRGEWENINKQLEEIARHLLDIGRSLKFLKKTKYSDIFQGVYERIVTFIKDNSSKIYADDHRLKIQRFCKSMEKIFDHLKGLLREVDDQIIEKEKRVESLESVLLDFAKKHNKI